MSSKVIITGLEGIDTKPAPISVDKPFVIQTQGSKRHLAFVAQTEPGVYQLIALDMVRKAYALNRMTDKSSNLRDVIKTDTLREYIEENLGFKVIDCDIELIINIS